jgi:MoxR-like ATPase
MAEASRASALLSGRPTVGFEDVKAVAASVLNHRVILNYQARFDSVDTFSVVNSILTALDEADLNLPDDLEVHSVP